MKLFPDETFLVYKTPLVGDVFLLMYWDLDKREFATFLGEEVEKKRVYLDRMGEKLRRQIETLILTNGPLYRPTAEGNVPT